MNHTAIRSVRKHIHLLGTDQRLIDMCVYDVDVHVVYLVINFGETDARFVQNASRLLF